MDRLAPGSARIAAIVSCAESALARKRANPIGRGASAGAMGPADSLSPRRGLLASGNAAANIVRAKR